MGQQITQDYSSLIGRPYSELDCWQLVREFYRIVFNAHLKAYYDNIPETRDIAKSIVYDSMRDFIKVSDRQFGDLFLIKMLGVECHIAVYLGDGLMLHTSISSGAIIERVARWEKMIVGTYRAKNDPV